MPMSVAASSDRSQVPIPGPGLTIDSIWSNLRARKRIRNRPQAEVAAALHWGAPLLDSSLTLITKDCLYYRGSSALELALSRSFWEVALLVLERPLGGAPCSSPFLMFGVQNATSDPFHLQQSWLIERSHSDPLGYQLAMPFAGETGTADRSAIPRLSDRRCESVDRSRGI